MPRSACKFDRYCVLVGMNECSGRSTWSAPGFGNENRRVSRSAVRGARALRRSSSRSFAALGPGWDGSHVINATSSMPRHQCHVINATSSIPRHQCHVISATSSISSYPASGMEASGKATAAGTRGIDTRLISDYYHIWTYVLQIDCLEAPRESIRD